MEMRHGFRQRERCQYRTRQGKRVRERVFEKQEKNKNKNIT